MRIADTRVVTPSAAMANITVSKLTAALTAALGSKIRELRAAIRMKPSANHGMTMRRADTAVLLKSGLPDEAVRYESYRIAGMMVSLPGAKGLNRYCSLRPVLHFAIPERPILAARIDEIDPYIFLISSAE